MKQLIFHLLSCIVGGALGAFSAVFVFPVWFRLGWRAPVYAWLRANRLQTIAAYWNSPIWSHLPDWVLLALCGCLCGFFALHHPIAKSLLLGTAFILVPEMIAISEGFGPFSFGPRAFLTSLVWDSIGIAIGISSTVAAHSIRKHRRRTEGQGFVPTISGL